MPATVCAASPMTGQATAIRRVYLGAASPTPWLTWSPSATRWGSRGSPSLAGQAADRTRLPRPRCCPIACCAAWRSSRSRRTTPWGSTGSPARPRATSRSSRRRQRVRTRTGQSVSGSAERRSSVWRQDACDFLGDSYEMSESDQKQMVAHFSQRRGPAHLRACQRSRWLGGRWHRLHATVGFRSREIRVPVYLSYGRQDTLVPAAHGDWLAAHVPQRRWLSTRTRATWAMMPRPRRSSPGSPARSRTGRDHRSVAAAERPWRA